MRPDSRNEHHRLVAARPGFSLVELLLVLLVAGILAGISIPQFGKYLNKRELSNARDAFTFIAARARTSAIERGDIVFMEIRPGLGRVVVVAAPPANDTLEVLDLAAGPSRANLVHAATVVTICYTPRGFAHPSCSATLPQTFDFARGSDTLRAVINAIGQVERQ